MLDWMLNNYETDEFRDMMIPDGVESLPYLAIKQVGAHTEIIIIINDINMINGYVENFRIHNNYLGSLC